MKEKIENMIVEVIKQIESELHVGDELFTESNTSKAISVNPFITVMLCEHEKDYFELRARLSEIKISLCKYNSKGDNAIIEASSTLAEAIKIHKSLSFINSIVKCKLVEHGVIERDSLSELLGKVNEVIYKLENRQQLVNPFIVYDTPSKHIFLNSDDVINKLNQLKETISDHHKQLHRSLVVDQIRFIHGALSNHSFKQISRDFSLSGGCGTSMSYIIEILDSSELGKIFLENKTDQKRLCSILSVLNWNLFNYVICPEKGIVLTLKIDDKYCLDSSLNKETLC